MGTFTGPKIWTETWKEQKSQLNSFYALYKSTVSYKTRLHFGLIQTKIMHIKVSDIIACRLFKKRKLGLSSVRKISVSFEDPNSTCATLFHT